MAFTVIRNKVLFITTEILKNVLWNKGQSELGYMDVHKTIIIIKMSILDCQRLPERGMI